MITSDKIFRMIKNFERVLPYANKSNSLDMSEADVSVPLNWTPHRCGTTHCHAGWYFLARRWDFASTYISNTEVFGFSKGTELMARELGMPNSLKLQNWAQANPGLWGNENGSAMFCNSVAFNYEGSLTLKKIIHHWGEVGMRLLIQELYEEGEHEE